MFKGNNFTLTFTFEPRLIKKRKISKINRLKASLQELMSTLNNLTPQKR